MLLTITNSRYPATDLSFLLHKHPAKVQSVEVMNGKAHVFYPAVSDEKCTCAILLDMDPVGLVRNSDGNSFALDQYVNDRPYVASSFMSSAISKGFSSALNGNCKEKPELVGIPLQLEVQLSVLSIRGGEELLQELFQPLGYEIIATQHPLDPHFPEWGNSRYFTVTLKHSITLQTLLSHLYVLIPVMDNEKHYWVNEEEITKLMNKGKGWLEGHPARETIVHRYLRYQRKLSNEALSAMTVLGDSPVTEKVEKPKLHDLRLQAVADEIARLQVSSVIDLGCGEGRLIKVLLENKQLQRITGMDVSAYSLEVAARRLKLDKMIDSQRKRINLIQGSLTYKDRRLQGYDVAALVEVIEHLDEDRLLVLEKNVFNEIQPDTVVLTTPNKEWNITFTEDENKMRHSDHRFEWTRAEFSAWCEHIRDVYKYAYEIKPLGEEMEAVGAPSQMAVFSKQ
ncbi:3' terminal RNA ribose 2'-O-methyltransferase Hen1 [Chitinophaga sancti]|uniref:Small RNA 2'-O-methyltransferase n=1 Tax=Chitinophaga sancti TaxID=1004 RepID=A0A1K1RYZ9_9BACT|nr:3' terminal RNA ribose 2'-O-methyltransferase Hen1 [Chitinophaga sancti]WQD64100.1 3' terminal RNA ribose 2'-O-methyltransferase Hen1 [Chitinophaga sancti]WQG90276.1 3' terminal RNA ribose 2'-O-methyltransferase Hen1 [Chitinophaga sancti]SFW77028.1 3' terminal RNA ribose 2'-O-methyltransferase Hen1 [Chitinophaga sancti]